MAVGRSASEFLSFTVGANNHRAGRGEIPVLVELRPRFELRATPNARLCRHIPYSLDEVNHFSREMNHRFLWHNHMTSSCAFSHRLPDTVFGEEQMEAFHHTFHVGILLLRPTILCHFLSADCGVILKHCHGSTMMQRWRGLRQSTW